MSNSTSVLKGILAAASMLAVSPTYSLAGAQQTHAVGKFDLAITRSSVLRPGKSHLDATSATVTYTNEFLRGRVNALKIEMPAGDKSRAVFVFMLNAANEVTQADLTIVVPGTSVGRTIAWTPAALAKYFPNVRYDGSRLRLVSKGSYDSLPDTPTEALTMSWDVDIDAAVVRHLGVERSPR